MCKYSILAQNSKGVIRYCYDCGTFNLLYGNILMNFNSTGFTQFKENVTKCYEENIKCNCERKRRDIFFNTRVEGLQLVFSTDEVGDLLSMIQAANLESIMLLGTEFDNN